MNYDEQAADAAYWQRAQKAMTTLTPEELAGTDALCPSDDEPLDWVDDQWHCSRCGDEFSEEGI